MFFLNDSLYPAYYAALELGTSNLDAEYFQEQGVPISSGLPGAKVNFYWDIILDMDTPRQGYHTALDGMNRMAQE